MKPCLQCATPFTIREQDRAFYEKINVPEPTLCPFCRHIRRHGFINDYVFFNRTCDNCDKRFITLFPQESEYTVYCQSCWFAEERDDKAQGREYDPNRSFFEQFDELMHAAPQLGIIGMQNENCDYCESIANCKNSYLISECSNCEHCYYSYWIQKSRSLFDCNYCHECEKSYELENCFNCYGLRYSQNCNNCSDSAFLDNCIGCKNCLFSTNLRHKEFYIFNKPYSEEEYRAKLEELNLGSYKTMKVLQKKFQEFLTTQPRKHLQVEQTENCTGDYIRNAKNCHHVFHCYDAEECSYGEHIWRGAKFCVDSNSAGRDAELSYEATNSGIGSYNVRFVRYCWGSHDVQYSNSCKRGMNLFGCVSLKPGAKFCILNKQYSEHDYHALVEKIVQKMKHDGEYGEFFPLSISLFGYNTTISYDEHPLSKEEVVKRGWKWEDQKSGTFNKGTLEMADLPDEIKDAPEEIAQELLTCTECARNYKVIAQELEYYKKQSIPLPRNCPDCRLRSRLARRNKKKLIESTCSNCTKEIQTTLDPNTFAHIMCTECYNAIVC